MLGATRVSLLVRGPSALRVRAAGTKWRHGDPHYHCLISISSARDSRLRFLSAPRERLCFRSFYVSVEGEAVYLCCSGLTAFSSASNIRFYRWIYRKRNIWSRTNGHKAHLNVRITADPCTHQNFCDSLFIFFPLLYFSGPRR